MQSPLAALASLRRRERSIEALQVRGVAVNKGENNNNVNGSDLQELT